MTHAFFILGVFVFTMNPISFAADKILQREVAGPASGLSKGMKLIYSSNGEEQSPWEIKNIESDISLEGWKNCARLEISYGDGAESRSECITEDGFLMVNYGGGWRQSRPVYEKMILEKKNPSGSLVAKYTTSEFSNVLIGGVSYSALQTEVINYNPDGSIKNRLLEKYSVGMATALEGAFQIPDNHNDSGWQTVNAFHLSRVEVAK